MTLDLFTITLDIIPSPSTFYPRQLDRLLWINFDLVAQQRLGFKITYWIMSWHKVAKLRPWLYLIMVNDLATSTDMWKYVDDTSNSELVRRAKLEIYRMF